jgi:hypothetical protein
MIYNGILLKVVVVVCFNKLLFKAVTRPTLEHGTRRTQLLCGGSFRRILTVLLRVLYSDNIPVPEKYINYPFQIKKKINNNILLNFIYFLRTAHL